MHVIRFVGDKARDYVQTVAHSSIESILRKFVLCRPDLRSCLLEQCCSWRMGPDCEVAHPQQGRLWVATNCQRMSNGTYMVSDHPIPPANPDGSLTDAHAALVDASCEKDVVIPVQVVLSQDDW